MNFGPAEWLVVLGILVLLFGARKLPELARSLGRSSAEFKRGMKEGQQDEPAVQASVEPPAPAEAGRSPAQPGAVPPTPPGEVERRPE
jgi:sec-independent protein translocase protein TatA